jgi:hypothetical protein
MRLWIGLLFSLIGAVVGLAIWFILLAAKLNPIAAGTLFWSLIGNPVAGWTLPLLGALIAGLTFLGLELLRKSN